MRDFIKHKLNKLLTEQKDKRTVAGVLITANDTGRVLLLLRNDGGEDPKLWSILTGGIEPGEEVLEGLKREVNEEISINPDIVNYKFIEKKFIKEKNMDFYYYEGFTKTEFLVKLDHENSDYGWFDKDNLPTPLYPGTKEKINEIWLNLS